MQPLSLPSTPVAVTSIERLSQRHDAIDHAIPITVTEVPVIGVADLTLSFVIERSNSGAWSAYVFERSEGQWRELPPETRVDGDVCPTSFDSAAEAITNYWTEHADRGEVRAVDKTVLDPGAESGLSVRTNDG
jgi:hypothetical protein